MQLHNNVYILESMQGRWAEFVEQARADIETLADRFIECVQELDVYRDGAISIAQVRLDALSSFNFLLDQIVDNDESLSDGICTARQLGRDRARIGIPLNHLLSAVRLDFKVLWEVFRSYAGPADRELLVDGVEKIWEIIERYSIEVQNGYIEESSRLADKRLSERTRLMTAILSSDVPAEEDLQSLATALGADPAGNFVVVAATVQGHHDLRTVEKQLAISGRVSHTHSTGHHSLLVSDWKGEHIQPIRKLLSGTVCGLAPVIHGISGLGRACHLAIEIAELNAARGHGPAELKDLWLPFLALRLRDVAPELVQSVLARFDTVSEAEQQRLIEAAWVFARSGSVSKTAAQVYCHRNTVLNRLRRIEELTGHDITVPIDAAMILLAILASRPEATMPPV